MNSARLLLPAALALAALPAGAAAQAHPYARADSVALAVPTHARGSVDSVSRYLFRGLDTEAERARAVYRFVAENIEYDAAAYFGVRIVSPSAEPDAVLRRRRAVCDGFAQLVAALGRRGGLEVALVPGIARGGNGRVGEVVRGGHSWNAVKVDGEWKLMDASWGAGDLIGRAFVRRFRDFYFFTPPEKLIFDHLPRDSRWQLLGRRVSDREFFRQVLPTRDFWELGWTVDAVRSAGPELVRAFPVPGRPLRVLEAPAAARLAPGAPVRLALHAPGATEVVAVSGEQWTPLEGAGDGAFAGRAAVAADRLTVMVRYPERPEGVVVLEYRAAGPARR